MKRISCTVLGRDASDQPVEEIITINRYNVLERILQYFFRHRFPVIAKMEWRKP